MIVKNNGEEDFSSKVSRMDMSRSNLLRGKIVGQRSKPTGG